MSKANIYLLRHGEITHTQSLAGCTNFDVTELGAAQMLSAMGAINFEQCISSPLNRCKVAAQQYCQQHQIELSLDNNIMEMNFGDWDGQAYDALWQLGRPNIGDFWQSPVKVTPPNGESFEQFVSRVQVFWTNLVNNEKNSDTLIVTHAGVIKIILALVLSEQHNIEQIEKIVSTISVDYAHVITLSVYKEPNFPAHVQIKL